jgi:homoserine dehydrogenase
VGQSLVGLLHRKRNDLQEKHEIAFRITGLATRRLGWLFSDEGFTPERILGGDYSEGVKVAGLLEWIRETKANVLFEASSLNADTGEPAITYIRAAVESRAHAISANKGPVVYAHRELSELAQARGVRFFHESAMMDGAPVFSLFRETLPAIEIHGFRGVLNSTTNVILECMESGTSFDDAVREAQRLGVAETDPSNDVDGIDAAVKVIGLANVLMGGTLTLRDVSREGIRGLTAAQLHAAHENGTKWKLISRAQRESDGRITASVAPERVTPDDPVYAVRGTSLAIGFQTDIFRELWISERDPGPEATAYGMLSDFINAFRST